HILPRPGITDESASEAPPVEPTLKEHIRRQCELEHSRGLRHRDKVLDRQEEPSRKSPGLSRMEENSCTVDSYETAS
ncbi:mCG145380, partial [Mus musculus]